MAKSILKNQPRDVYLPGESIALEYCYGYITDSGKELNLFFPVGKFVGNIGITVSSSSFLISLRRGDNTGGYVQSQNFNAISYLNTATFWGGLIQIVFVKSDGWGTTNNIPVTGSTAATVTFR